MIHESRLTVLLGEDDDEDAYLFERALGVSHPACRVLRFENGAELIIELYRTIKYETPVVFMDLAMPLLNGFQALEQIRETASLAHVPVFVLSASEADSDIHRAYGAGADAYLIKPVTARQLAELIKPAVQYAQTLLAIP